MTLDDISIIGKTLTLSSQADVDAAEIVLAIQFPVGYREYVTRFGDGVLGGCYIRIYPPERILAEEAQYRERIGRYWFWGEDQTVLTQQQALKSIMIGDTVDGDQLVILPSNPERIFVLPRNRERIYMAGDGLLDAISWLCDSGTLTEPFKEREFEPV